MPHLHSVSPPTHTFGLNYNPDISVEGARRVLFVTDSVGVALLKLHKGQRIMTILRPHIATHNPHRFASTPSPLLTFRLSDNSDMTDHLRSKQISSIRRRSTRRKHCKPRSVSLPLFISLKNRRKFPKK